jgi:hypothetical protein
MKATPPFISASLNVAVAPTPQRLLRNLLGVCAAAGLGLAASAQTNFNTLSFLTTFGGHGDGYIHPGDQPYVTGQSTTPYPGRDFQRGFALDPVTGTKFYRLRKPTP